MKQFILTEDQKNGIVNLLRSAIFPQLTADQIIANINAVNSLPEAKINEVKIEDAE
jgi:hypothetical protein